MEIIVFPLLWVLQGLYHQLYTLRAHLVILACSGFVVGLAGPGKPSHLHNWCAANG